MPKKRQPIPYNSLIADAVSDACSNASELRDELESWYDNLPENFQSGDKGDQLQEAMSNLEINEPDVPDALSDISCAVELPNLRRPSRAARCNECVIILDGCVTAAETEKDRLEALNFDEDGNEINDDNEIVEGGTNEGDRDNAVSEIETFISECEEARDQLESVEFPGMFG